MSKSIIMDSYHRKLQHFVLRNFFEKHFNFFQKCLRNTFREKLYQPFDYKNHMKNIHTWFISLRWLLWIAAIENQEKIWTSKFFSKVPSKFFSRNFLSAIYLPRSRRVRWYLIYILEDFFKHSCHWKSKNIFDLEKKKFHDF